MSFHHSPRHSGDTRAAVTALLDEGLTRAQVAGRLRVSKATVSYHAKRLGLRGSPACARRYDWAEVQRYYDAGHSISECQLYYRFTKAAWANAARRGAVVARPQATPLADMLVQGSARGRWNLKRRLIAAGLKEPACEECGLTEWRGQAITLQGSGFSYNSQVIFQVIDSEGTVSERAVKPLAVSASPVAVAEPKFRTTRFGRLSAETLRLGALAAVETRVR